MLLPKYFDLKANSYYLKMDSLKKLSLCKFNIQLELMPSLKVQKFINFKLENYHFTKNRIDNIFC